MLEAALGGWSTNAVEFQRAPKDGCRSGGVRWQTVDLLKGVRNRLVCSRKLRVTSANFVPYGSVRSRKAKLVMSLSPDLGPGTHLDIAAGAGLYVTSRGPAEIKLDASGCRKVRRVSGRWTRATIEIKNRGDRPATRVRLGVVPASEVNVKIRMPRRLRIPAGKSRLVPLSIETLRTGLVPLRLLATSNSNQAAAICRLRFQSATGTQGGGFLGTGLSGTTSGIGSAVLALVGLTVLLKLIRRKNEAIASSVKARVDDS